MLSLVWPIASLGVILAMAQEAMTAADRINEIFDTESAIIVRHRACSSDPRGHLRFEDVGFRFPDSRRAVLHDVNLEVAPGETVALVGATGSGKTTLTALVPRLYDVTAGRITIDGVDVRDLTLSRCGTVVATAFEEPTLFSMSARENLTLGRPRRHRRRTSTQALETAQAEFVYDLPWGLETRIGEQGMSLSGGQRQRLALARAVLAQPRILVLDDTLSALDVHTEALVEEALRRVLADATGIVVAHRASTVMLADKVALLQDGTITHVGDHSELLADGPGLPRPARGRRRRLEEVRRMSTRRRRTTSAARPRPDENRDRRDAPEESTTGAESRPRTATTTSTATGPGCCRTGPAGCSAAAAAAQEAALVLLVDRACSRTPPGCRSRSSSSRASTAASRRSRRPATPRVLLHDRGRSSCSRVDPGDRPAAVPDAVRQDRAGHAARRCAAGSSRTSRGSARPSTTSTPRGG